MIVELTTQNRRAQHCKNCGDSFAIIQADLSYVCAAKIVGWTVTEKQDGRKTIKVFTPRTIAGCGLQTWLCPNHGLRTRTEGDTRCRCSEFGYKFSLT